MKQQTELNRGLEERHITLMSLGAAIGVGLFLGSATAIKLAGPGILLAYLLGGVIIYIIMRALGELAVREPVAGSFAEYARKYVSPLAGFLTGWNYWLLWIFTCMAEITAVGIYMQEWFPQSERWAWALGALILMTSINFVAVKFYGEFEFWFALIKIVAIVAMIVLGILTIVVGFGNGGTPVGISNLWAEGGFLPNGFGGVLLAMQMVMFAFLGIEVIGVTAGEAKNPKKTIKKAVNNVFWRILIFYVGALFVILSIYPWNEVGKDGSPFVLLFDQLGIPAAAGIINFVVLTAALSSCNSGIFSTARMMFNLAENSEAPRRFARLSRNGVPALATVLSGAALLVGVVLNYFLPESVFAIVTSIATFGAVWTWAMILIAQMRARKVYGTAEFGVPFFPVANYIALFALAGVIVLMAFSESTRIALIVGPLWYAVLIAVYYARGMHKETRTLKRASGE
ncbi:amino acid permease [Exiguobacterium flavidum]|uniref:amino acid permease n=1 Tax=Exiguobacterium flavidum TaxID=2184695 RepID=UPI000DF7C5EF|nr:amino acid permease [Exiguobacterium flavidum]